MPEPSGTVPNLSSLNETERVVLGLLAEGHTAKSIATATGRSVGAINERLREARRKTGIGSSRELARMLAAQKDRDQNIGVADRHLPAPSDPSTAASGRSRKGTFIMAMGLMGGIAAFALLTQISPHMQTIPQSDVSLIGTHINNPSADARELVSRLISEKRDDIWAARTEPALIARFASIPQVSEPIKVKCAATLCEVAGWIGPTDRKGTNIAMQALQGEGLRADMLKLGIDSESIWFANDKTYPLKTSFVMFWSRTRG